MTNKKGNKSNPQWLKEHFTDPFVKQAHIEGYRSRAVYKLKEIEERDHLFKPGMTVVDLGAAPGSWCQYLIKIIHPKGQLIAVDLLPMESIGGVNFIQGDFQEDIMVTKLLNLFLGKKAHWVISDLMPNMTGNESIDMPRSLHLNELVLDFALKVVMPSGGLLMKVFQGEGFDKLLIEIKRHFKKVIIRKPKASRGKSREVYILARDLKVSKSAS